MMEEWFTLEEFAQKPRLIQEKLVPIEAIFDVRYELRTL